MRIIERTRLGPQNAYSLNNGHKSKVKFMGEISEYFEVRTRVRRGDEFSLLLFNCVLKNTRMAQTKVSPQNESTSTLGSGKIAKDCLVFADDLTMSQQPQNR